MAQSLRDALASELNCTPGLSFAKYIAPLFNSTDVQHMLYATNSQLDLSQYDSVKVWAHAIYKKVSEHIMPPPPADPWTPDMVNTFACWIQQGMAP